MDHDLGQAGEFSSDGKLKKVGMMPFFMNWIGWETRKSIDTTVLKYGNQRLSDGHEHALPPVCYVLTLPSKLSKQRIHLASYYLLYLLANQSSIHQNKNE